MAAQILDGRRLNAIIKQQVSEKIKTRLEQGLIVPTLEVILVGDNPASASYVGHKERACKEVGIQSHVHRLPKDTSFEKIAALIDQNNANPKAHGILLQLPLPDHINPDDLLERIHPNKDVDGFHPYNLGRLIQRRPTLRPCTPFGVINLLKHFDITIAGKNAVVVGASNIVGRPMALELLLEKATVTVCHRFTASLEQHVKEADIVIVAVGNYDIVKSEWIKAGAIVVDVGFSRREDGSITGDIDFETAKEKASWITPVPGGVGPMTVATLLQNTLQAAEMLDES